MEALLGHPDDNMVVSEIGISEPWEPMQITPGRCLRSCTREILKAYVIGGARHDLPQQLKLVLREFFVVES